MNQFEQFRKDNPVFIYRSYNVTETEDEVKISYVFSIPNLAEFTPSWSFPKSKDKSFINDRIFDTLAFSLGVAETVSYWKAVCSPEVIIECGSLSDEQVKWWKKLWYMGLGEFFYVNEINTDIESLVNITSKGNSESELPENKNALSGCLVPIGGGKDSALTLETLVNAGMECKCYAINKRVSITKTVTTAGLDESSLITAKRNFDRSLVELNRQGYLNGHTPFSSIVAFSAEITAYINNLKYIVLSNEDSANESTVAGQEVNHQYSKSFEFEKDFHEYEGKYLKTGIYYFSFLRPLSEFQIAKMFVSHRKYLPIFRSCNLGSKLSPDVWCGMCAKCLFVSLILSPFLTENELTDIFGKDLLEDEENNLSLYFDELIGKSEHKPFECVGSVSEVNLAVSLALRRMKSNGEKIPKLFGKYEKSGLYNPNTLDERNDKLCKSFSNENLLPEKFKNILIGEMERLL